jgi:hypothetical protein
MLLFSMQCFGQAVYGSISGTVRDQQGGVVPNAKVTVTDISKGTTDTATTNESGNYSVTHLIPDVYSVKVEAPSFGTLENKAVQVSADTVARVDATLQAGNVAQSVEVTAEAPQLQTERADVATIFNERAVEQLPTFDRNFTNFLLLSPGTTKQGWSHASSENPQGSQQIFVNGQQFAGTSYELDGTDNQDPILGIIVVNPNLDSVTETKITAQNYDAEFGKAIAGVVATQTKSGSNQLHGSAFIFRRSDVFQARDPFVNSKPDPITGKFLPPTLWNQFGGSLGGPIVKDKLFIFGDYQGTREKTGNSFFETVPTNLVRSTCLAGLNCDLSEYVNGGQNQVFLGPSGQGAARTAAPGNIIPAGLISPQAVALLNLLPAPTTGGTVNNFVATGFGIFNVNNFDVRVDNATTTNLHLFGRYSLQRFNLASPGAFGVAGGQGFGPGGFAGNSNDQNQSLATGFDYTVSPSLITDFRLGYFRYHVHVTPNDFGSSPMTAAGIPNLNLDNNFTSGFSQIITSNGNNDIQTRGGISEFGEGLDVGRCNCPLTEDEHQYQFVNNWTKMAGNHQIKFGGDFRLATNLRVPSDQHRAGVLTFDRAFTSDPSLSVPGGSGLATFLLGDVTSIQRYVSSTTTATEHQKRAFFYGQDTWRMTPKLTLNYGLRWETYFPETVDHPGEGALFNINDGLLHVANTGGIPSNMGVDTNYHNFAPRLGLAYQATPNTVVRLGYGRSYDIGVFGSVFGHTVTQNLPVLANQSSTANGSSASLFTLANTPPPLAFPTVPQNGLLAVPTGVNPRGRPFDSHIPTLDAWNITIQQQFGKNLSGEIAYVGNKGTHVFAGNNPDINPNEPSVIGFKEGIPKDQRRPFFNAYPNLYPVITDASGNVTGGGFTNDVTYFANASSSNYHALQTRLDKRFSQGLQFQANYTWSRALNFDQDYFVNQPHYGLVDFNRKHVFIFNSVYDLPFGHGRMFGGGWAKPVDWILGGWQLSGTLNWSSGLPFSASYGECGADIDVGPCWAAHTGTTNINVSGLQTPANGSPFVQFFNPVAPTDSNGNPFGINGAPGNGFARPAAETFGSRNSLYGPRYFNTDASLAKNLKITERLTTQFRVEAFNLFNHPQLGTPNSCIDCGGNAGQITGLQSNIAQMRNLQFALRFDF